MNDGLEDINDEGRDLEISITPGETVYLYSTRETPTNLILRRSQQFSPERDASILEVYLSQSLPTETLRYFTELIILKYSKNALDDLFTKLGTIDGTNFDDLRETHWKGVANPEPIKLKRKRPPKDGGDTPPPLPPIK